MQKTLVAAALAAVLGVGGSAYAGDLASGGMRGAPNLGPVAIWTGAYLGGNFGGAWGDNNTTDLDGYWHKTYGSAALKTTQQISGVLGGGQAGYNLQAGTWCTVLKSTSAIWALAAARSSPPTLLSYRKPPWRSRREPSMAM